VSEKLKKLFFSSEMCPIFAVKFVETAGMLVNCSLIEVLKSDLCYKETLKIIITFS
jgi:hypothetical protein